MNETLANIGEILGTDAFKYLNVRRFIDDLQRFHADDPRTVEILDAFRLVERICLESQK